MPPELALPPMPAELRLILPLFLEIATSRGFSQGVPRSLAPTEIAAWLLLRGIRPNSRVLWFIRALDSAWLRSIRTGAAA